MPESAPPPNPATVADAEDSGWNHESAGVSMVPPLNDGDTTAKPPPATPVPAAPTETETEDDELEGTDEPGEPKPPVAAAADKGGKPKKPSLQKTINRLTQQTRAAERRTQELQTQLENFRRAPTLPAPVAATPAGTPPPPAEKSMPLPPKYGDYETDSEYQTALTKWQTEDVPKWQKDREDALTAKITGGLDARLNQTDDDSARLAHENSVLAAIERAKASHPDWDEKKPVLSQVQSAWYDPQKHPSRTPFLSDIVKLNPDGPEFLYWLMSHPDAAQDVADLLPSAPLRDAIFQSPVVIKLMEHFSTDVGRLDFQSLRTLPQAHCMREIGRIEARLEAAVSGPAPTGRPAPITGAVPPAKPPSGAPRAPIQPPSGSPPDNFESWMDAEDAREHAERLKQLGIAV